MSSPRVCETSYPPPILEKCEQGEAKRDKMAVLNRNVAGDSDAPAPKVNHSELDQ